MFFSDILLGVKPLMEDQLKKAGYVLVDMRFFRRSGHELVLEVLLDREEGGVTLEECSQLNRQIGQMLDDSGRIPESYTLEVSSPGTDRPLATPSDFRRTRGRGIRVFLREPVAGKIEYAGKLQDVTEDRIILETDDGIRDICLDKINKAKQVIA